MGERVKGWWGSPTRPGRRCWTSRGWSASTWGEGRQHADRLPAQSTSVADQVAAEVLTENTVAHTLKGRSRLTAYFVLTSWPRCANGRDGPSARSTRAPGRSFDSAGGFALRSGAGNETLCGDGRAASSGDPGATVASLTIAAKWRDPRKEGGVISEWLPEGRLHCG